MAKKKTANVPQKKIKGESLLIELLTEELPPKSLQRLSQAFASGVLDGLKEKYFLGDRSAAEVFATPRRLAVRISGVLVKQPDRVVERKGPSVQAGLDPNGQPTQALLGFARSCGTDVKKLERRKDDKGEYFLFSAQQAGELLAKHLALIVETSLKKLPVAKLMRWGSRDTQFVRPVHGLIALHGNKVVPCEVLGLKSGNKTLGHRFLSKGAIVIARAADYEKTLEKRGNVIASFEKRRDAIVRELDKAAAKLVKGASWRLGKEMDLVDEVTSIVESPRVYVGSFDDSFLDVPRECLIVSMQQHQKYFPVADAQGTLQSKFLFVANMHPKDASQIVHGNERVLRARLSDAKFFFDQDRRQTLEERVPRLANVVYHNKLGSQLERVQRITRLVEHIVWDKRQTAAVEQAAYLCKADLLTDMVGEFPELQGIMGRYYARHDGAAPEVADAVEQHYFPRTAGGALPQGMIAVTVALADKLDTLVGIYGIGLGPTGDKDPFGLRRAALGVIRILIEQSLPLDFVEMLERTRHLFPNNVLSGSVVQDLRTFFMDRLRPYLRERGYAPDEIDAVLALNPTRLDHIIPRLEALKKFRALPEGMALAAANKRIRNILRQAGQVNGSVNAALLAEDSEKKLESAVQSASGDVRPMLDAGDYAAALKRLATLRPAVDEFFDKVMVMADDSALRNNRLALLNNLGDLFLNVADVSRLQG